MTPKRRSLPPNLVEQMSGPFYMGPTTFMKTVALSEPSELDEWEPDVAILGIPWDAGVSNRPGARYGPRSIRVANYVLPYWHLELEVAPFDALCVVDYGDVMCPLNLVEATHSAIVRRVKEIATRGIMPVIIGGDHSITYPSAQAVAQTRDAGKLGIIHFDAHADTYPDISGNLYSHASPMRRLIESGAVPGRNFVQIGLRGYIPPPDLLDWMHAQQMRWHLMAEIWDRGVDAVIDTAIQEALDGPDYIYLSLDIDVVDPGFAPGTGSPEPAGMYPKDLLRAIRRVVLSTNVVAMDVVEVSPPYDPAEITAQLANRCILEALSALAVKTRNS